MSEQRSTFWKRVASVLVLAFAVLVTGIPASFVQGVIPAEAQERRRNLLDIFRPRKRRAAPQRRVRQPSRARRAQPNRQRAAPRRAVRRKSSTRRRKAAPAVAAAPEVPRVEKIENAKVVLVIGDFLASSLADGLDEAFADSPGVRIVDAGNGASGIVRDDFYDWQEAVPELVEKHKPVVIVVQIGANDRQPIRSEGGSEAVGSAGWVEAYQEKIGSLNDALRETQVPFVWLGTPAFASRALTADMVTFNEYYETATRARGGTFVDIWDGFVDRNGAYVRSGPDVNGQVVRLRGSDGINLTSA